MRGFHPCEHRVSTLRAWERTLIELALIREVVSLDFGTSWIMTERLGTCSEGTCGSLGNGRRQDKGQAAISYKDITPIHAIGRVNDKEQMAGWLTVRMGVDGCGWVRLGPSLWQQGPKGAASSKLPLFLPGARDLGGGKAPGAGFREG